MKRTVPMAHSALRYAAATVLMMMLPALLWAAGTKPGSGDGSSSNPYQISTAAHLTWFRDAVNGVNTGTGTGVAICGKLTANITLSGTWTPIGNKDKKYTGTFDGNGKTISGMSIASYTSTYQGLFGYINGATLRNFTLHGTMTSTKALTGNDDATGTVVGRAAGATTIQDVTSDVSLTITGVAQKHLGGIVGAMEGTTQVSRCVYSGTMNVGNSTDCVGGIVGFAYASCSGTIQYCYSTAALTTSGSGPTLGGILGYTNDESSNFGGVQNCLGRATFSYTGSANYVNGIVGRIRNRATTTKNNCYLPTNGIPAKACNTDGPSIPATNVAVTLDDCKQGRATWLLNGSANGTAWRQTLGTDTYPTLSTSASRIYQVNQLYCDGTVYTQLYLNTTTCSTVQHEFTTHHAGKAATCTSAGSVESDYCTRCNTDYDKNMNVVTNHYIRALGHAYNADSSYCSRCKHGFLRYESRIVSGFCDMDFTNKSFGNNVTYIGTTRDKGNSYYIVEMTGKITTIPDEAFITANVIKIWLPEGLTKIGRHAFLNCRILSTPTFPNTLTDIDDNAFEDCTGMQGELKLPPHLSHLGQEAFSECIGLTGLEIPATLTACDIEVMAFNNTHVENVTNYCLTPQNFDYLSLSSHTVVRVPSQAAAAYQQHPVWKGWTIECITHPAFVHRAETEGTCYERGLLPHYECPKCGVMSTDAQGTQIATVDDLGKARRHNLSPTDSTQCLSCNHALLYYKGASKIELSDRWLVKDEYSIGNVHVIEVDDTLSVFKISNTYLSSHKSDLYEIVLPHSVKRIADFAFYGCENLGKCILPQHLEVISYAAFKGCTSLTSIQFPETLKELRDAAFAYCQNLSGTLRIPSGVRNIGTQAFSNCSKIEHLILPEELQTIGASSFDFCTGLKGTLVIPNSVTSIGEHAFYACTMDTVMIGTGVKNIDLEAFYGSGFKYMEVDFDQTCEIAANWVNGRKTGVLVYSDELTNIPEETFSNGLTPIPLKRGDVDRNGTVSVADICHFLQMQRDGTLTTHDLKTADTDRSGTFSPHDIQGIVTRILTPQ